MNRVPAAATARTCCPGLQMLAACLMLVGSHAQAADKVRSEATITLAFALEVATAAMRACASMGARVGVVVVDASGATKVALRADAARPHVIEFAQRKAYTSAMLRYSTERMVEKWWAERRGSGLLTLPGVVDWRGGAPILIDDEVVGGIGISGDRGGSDDVDCIDEAFDKTGLERPSTAAARAPKPAASPTADSPAAPTMPAAPAGPLATPASEVGK